ncbi:2-keto-4-pentenoate hydratase/2-oxohepta-3-ene-1,7-dioic acid hydratase in catechol pathway [Skermanella aerolata]
MRLLRFGPPGAEKPALLAYDQTVRDLLVLIDDIEPETLTDQVLDQLREADLEILPIVQGRPRIGPCVGLNYSDHAAKLGERVPPEPVLLLKATSSICGPADDIVLPRGANETDWGGELGVVTGRRAAYVAEEEALVHLAGYCVVNDVSERAFQYEHFGH